MIFFLYEISGGYREIIVLVRKISLRIVKSDHKRNKYVCHPQEIKPDQVTRLALRKEVNFESICRKVRFADFVAPYL